jgi:hypothetical protein
MDHETEIRYYCFNKRCHYSVYDKQLGCSTNLPMNEAVLAADHYCRLCHSRLVSLIDLEVRKTILVNVYKAVNPKQAA